MWVGQVDGFNLFVLQPHESSLTKADQFNWFVVGKKVHTKLEICANWVRTEPTKRFFCCAFVCRIYSVAEVRTRAESRAKFAPPSLFSGSRVEHQPSSFVVREAREGQVLNASAQIHRDESGKYSNGTRPPQRCPFAIRGLSKHMSIRTGGRLTTNSRRPFSFILCGLGTAHASADRIPQSCRSGINKVRVTPTTPLAFFFKKKGTDRKPCADFVSCFRSAVRVVRSRFLRTSRPSSCGTIFIIINRHNVRDAFGERPAFHSGRTNDRFCFKKIKLKNKQQNTGHAH